MWVTNRSALCFFLAVLGANSFVLPRRALRLRLALEDPVDLPAFSTAGGDQVMQHPLFSPQEPSSQEVEEMLAGSRDEMELMLAGMPSLNELYDKLHNLQHSLEQKDVMFQQTVEKLRAESEQTLSSMKEWDDFYNRKVAALEDGSRQIEQSLRTKEQEHLSQFSLLQQKNAASEKEAAEKIHFLGDKLQQLKLAAHQEQLAAAEAAKRETDVLHKKLDALEQALVRESAAKDLESNKAKEMWQRRIEIEHDLAMVKKSLQETVKEGERKVQAERDAREREQRIAQQQLVAEQEKAQRQINDIVEESKAHQASLRSSLKAKEEEFGQTLNQVRQSSLRKEKELSDSIGALGSQLQSVKFESHNALMAERTASEERQRDLRDLIRAKEAELQQATQQTSVLKSKADELLQQRVALEKEVVELKRQYDVAQRDWERRFKSAEESHQREKAALKEALTQQEADVKERLALVRSEVEFHRAALESGLADKDKHYTQTIEQLHAGATKTEKQLTEKLGIIAKQTETLRTDSEIEERRSALAQREALLAQIKSKEELLSKQIALTDEANKVAASHWSKRMEVELELSSLQHKYKTTIADWQARYQVLQDKLVHERLEKESLIVRTEEQAQKTLAAVTKKVEEQKSALQTEVQAREKHYGSLVDQMRSEAQQRESEYSKSLDAVDKELTNVKLASEKQLTEDKESFLKKQDELLAQIAKKEHELKVHLDEIRVAKSQTREQSQTRERVETELANLKRTHETALSEWGRRHKVLEAALQKERLEAEQRLSDVEKKARSEIESVWSETRARRATLQSALETKARESEKIVEALKKSSRSKENKLVRQIESMSRDLLQHKLESEWRLSEVRHEAELKQSELLNQIHDKEKQLALQTDQISDAKAATEAERHKRTDLERELATLRHKHDAVAKEWEARYSSLQEKLFNEQREAENRLAQKESEARALLVAAKGDAEARKVAFEERLRAKEATHTSNIDALQRKFEKQQSELTERLAALGSELQSFKFDAHNQNMAERAEMLQKQSTLKASISELETKLQEQEKLTGVECTRADQMWQKRLELEKEMQSLKAKHDNELAAWDSRFKTTTQTMVRERQLAEAQLARNERKAREAVEKARKEAEAHKTALDAERKAKDAASAAHIQGLQTSFVTKEKELQKALELIQSEYDRYRHQADVSMRQVQEIAATRERELTAQIDAKVKQIKDQEALIVLEKAQSNDITQQRVAMEGQLASLKAEHVLVISDLNSRYATLEQMRQREKIDAAEQLAKTEASAQKRLDDALATAEANKLALKSQLESKIMDVSDKMQALWDQSSKQEAEMSDRIRSVTNELQKFKIQAQSELARQKAEIEAEMKRQVDEAMDKGNRLAEHVRYDLTRELVKKEVQLIRQKGELKEKDAILAHGNFVLPEAPVKLQVSGVKDRAAKILRGEPVLRP